MRFFLDTEFLEDGRSVELLSLALVDERGRTYYAENADADLSRANAFVRAHVVPQLRRDPAHVKGREQIRDEVLAFVGAGEPEFWGYYSAYDWVLFSQLFGDFDAYHRLCRGWPMLCLDIEQLRRERPHVKLPASPVPGHHALADAQWVRAAWLALTA